jgi:hypothetical protein
VTTTHKIVFDDINRTAAVQTTEPTPEVIADALRRAQQLIRSDLKIDVIRALAEATTTAQSQGVSGFKVFRDTRAAVTKCIPPSSNLVFFNDTASTEQLIDVLDKAIKLVLA